jgi:hypothetical protein
MLYFDWMQSYCNVFDVILLECIGSRFQYCNRDCGGLCGRGSPLGSSAYHLPRAEDQGRGAGLSYSHDDGRKTLRRRDTGKRG